LKQIIWNYCERWGERGGGEEREKLNLILHNKNKRLNDRGAGC